MSAPRDAPARRPLLADWPIVVMLVLLWLCLWGSAAPLTILTGLVTAAAVTRLFELPALPVVHRVRPVAALVLVARLLADVVVASVQVAALAIAAVLRRRPPRTALVRVPLGLHDDLLLSLTAVAVSLIPGSIVIEADRDAGTLSLHVLGVRGERDAERARAAVRSTATRMARALAPREQRASTRGAGR